MRSEVLAKMGARIKERIRALETTHVQLAVDIDVPMTTIYNWAEGVNMPSPKNLERLAKGLRMNVSELLLGGQNDRRS